MASTRSIPVKVVRPRLPGVLARERLFCLLDEARQRPLTWISGPGGWGKTTLATSYVEARGLSCLWFHVDGGDADLAAFFHYLGLAARAVAPRRKGRFPPLSPEYLLGIPEFSRTFFARLAEWLPRPCLLVFDNCHRVPEDAPLYRTILEGRTRLAPEQTVVFVSRSRPPPALAQVQANRQLSHIGLQELRVTDEEFDAIAALHGVGPEGREALAPLRDTMHGWMAGLVLLLAGREFLFDGSAVAPEALPEAVFDYFSAEILARLEEEPRTFLLRTSFLPDMTAAQAEALTGQPGGTSLLAWLHRHNLFIEKREHSAPVYRYHPLFRRFLEAEARARFHPEEVTALQRAAAGLLAEAKRYEPAVGLLTACGDWEGLIGLILEQAPSLLPQGRIRTLDAWLARIPEDWVERVPWLSYWQGVARLPLNPPEAQAHFERAFDGFSQQGDEGPGRALAWAGILDAVIYGYTDFTQLDPWLARADEVVGAPETLPEGPVGARVAAAAYLAMSHRQPTRPDFAAWEERALALIETTEDPYCKVQVLTQAIVLTGCRGGGVEGEELFERVQALLRVPDPPAFVRISALFAEFYATCYVGGYLAKSVDITHRALGISRDTGVHLLDAMLTGSGVNGALMMGNLADAQDLLGTMQRLCENAGRFFQAFYHQMRSTLALHRGELETAALHVDRALDACYPLGFISGYAQSHTLRAAVHLARGEHDACREYLDKAEVTYRVTGWHCFLVTCELLRAQCHLELGDRDGAVASLRRAFGRAAEYSVRVLDPFVRPWAASLCALALAHDIEPELVRAFIRRLRLVPETPPVGVEAWPWPLRIYTLGRFEIVRDDEPLRFSGKAQQRPLALLRALIAAGGTAVAEVRLADALWPDADGDAARDALKTTLYRLRKLLGLPEAILHTAGTVSLDPRCVWVDIWALDRLLPRSATAPPEGQGIAELERGLDLYRGPFLAEEVSEAWALPTRERLRSRFLQAVEVLGDQLERAGRWEDAVARYRQALGVDPRVERFYQRLMLGYRKLGRTSEALTTYERCRTVLRKTFGIEPSPATERLRRDLLSDP